MIPVPLTVRSQNSSVNPAARQRSFTTRSMSRRAREAVNPLRLPAYDRSSGTLAVLVE